MLAWKLAQSPRVQIVYVAPGNGGTAQDERLQNIDITDPAALADFVEREHVALTVVGPEAPLAAGIVNLFRSRGSRSLVRRKRRRSWKARRTSRRRLGETPPDPDRASTNLHRRRRRPRLPRRERRADRREGRRPRGRQRRGRRDDARGSARGGRFRCSPTTTRRRRRACRDRGISGEARKPALS